MMAAEEEIEVEAPAPLMNLEEVHNSGNEVHDGMSTIEPPNDDESAGMYDASSSSSWTKKKTYATAALALASVAILAIVIGTPTGITANKNAVKSAMMNVESCAAIMKKLELDDSTPEPSTYEPTTQTPTSDPTGPPVKFSNDVADLVEALRDGSGRVRDLRGGRPTKHVPGKEARRMQEECEAIMEAQGGSSKSGKSTNPASKSGKSTKSSKCTKGSTSCVCIKIETGDKEFNEGPNFDKPYSPGYLDVFVKSGTTGYILVTGQKKLYELGVTVLDACYNDFIGIQVTNKDDNAWMGSILSSVDNKEYEPMKCLNCGSRSTSVFTGRITVDGNENPKTYTPAICEDSDTCTIVLNDTV